MLAMAATAEPRGVRPERADSACGPAFEGILKRQAGGKKQERHPHDGRDSRAGLAGSQGLLTPPNDDAPPPYGLHLVAGEETTGATAPATAGGAAAPKVKPRSVSTCPPCGAVTALIALFGDAALTGIRAILRPRAERTAGRSKLWAHAVQRAKAAGVDFFPEPAQVASAVQLAVCEHGSCLPEVICLLAVGACEIFCNIHKAALRHFQVNPFAEEPQAKIDTVIQLALEHQERERLRSYPKTNVIIITGANSGIGYEIAKAALRASYYVILACRSEIKALDAMHRLEMETGSRRIEFMELDLSDLQSVRDFAAEIIDRSLLCNVLVNNAGVMDVPYQNTASGLESQMAVNHLGHFLLTGLLINNIAHAGGRVVNMSSGAHYCASDVKYDRIVNEEKYSRLGNYAMSKLANVMFTTSLAAKAQNVIVNACHPGAVSTNLYSNNRVSSLLLKAVDLFLPPDTLFRSPVHGAVTPITLALHPSATFTGQYVYDERICRPNPAVLDPVKCEKLWKLSEERTGFRFTVV